MKKILAQHFVDETDKTNINVIYTVPAWLQTEVKSIYISHNNYKDSTDEKRNYNIRIVKSWDTVDWTIVPVGARENVKFKNILIDNPRKPNSVHPLELTNICMEEWDMIVLQSMVAGITVSVFGEELAHDQDDLIAAINGITNAINNLNTTWQNFPVCACP